MVSNKCAVLSYQKLPRSRACPTSRNIDPFCKTGAFLTLYIHNIGIAFAAAAHAILLGSVWLTPIFVLFDALFLVQCCLL
jgi:hypothetical protein